MPSVGYISHQALRLRYAHLHHREEFLDGIRALDLEATSLIKPAHIAGLVFLEFRG
jgi:hypothetical protein